MHNNNFDFLRLLLSLFVIITHSYVLSGIDVNEPLAWFTHHQITFANVALNGFFCISGYLVYQSLTRSKNILTYYRNRVLRIYPAFSTALVITLVICAFMYEGSIANYLASKSTWTYVPRNLTLVASQRTIAGVFIDTPKSGIINGSIWTIPYEIFLYIALSGLFSFPLN